MVKRQLFIAIAGRDGWTIQCFILSLVVLCAAATQALSSQEFNSAGWKHFREIHIPADVKEGLVGVALESELLEKCRPDLTDVRVVSSAGVSVPLLLTDGPDEEDGPPFPVRVFRVARRPGKFTEVWVDKNAKVLTRSVIIQTSSKDFVRKVELRGSDNARDTYVIRVDGLIADLAKPEPFRSLDIEHTLNNFQYIQIRILDDDQQPLKIENVLCGPANRGLNLTKSFEARITEKRHVASNNSTIVGVDLGQKRFPLAGVSISTGTKEFIKSIRISARRAENEDQWQEFYKGTLFRIRKDDTAKENLKARFKPQLSRYVRLELSGSGPPVNVDDIKATAAVRMAVFEHRKDTTYRIYYDNAQSSPAEPNPAPSATNLGQIAASSSEVRLGSEQNVPEAPIAKQVTPRSEEAPTQSILRRIAGVTLLLAGLLILFAAMLRTRRRRLSGGRRDPRILGKNDEFKISLREH